MFKEIMKKLILIIPILLTSCAAGSLTSVFSLRCMTAQELSRESEEKLIERIKTEIERSEPPKI